MSVIQRVKCGARGELRKGRIGFGSLESFGRVLVFGRGRREGSKDRFERARYV